MATPKSVVNKFDYFFSFNGLCFTVFVLIQSPTNKEVPDGMSSCKICGRNFNTDRLQKHETICQKAASKKRKIFDATIHRVKVSYLVGMWNGGLKTIVFDFEIESTDLKYFDSNCNFRFWFPVVTRLSIHNWNGMTCLAIVTMPYHWLYINIYYQHVGHAQTCGKSR